MKLNEQISRIKEIMGLNEKLVEVDDDVDYLYNRYFKHIIDATKQNIPLTEDMFAIDTTNTSMLLSPPAIEAHELNPCIIKIFDGVNGYSPLNGVIQLTINRSAISHILNYDGDYQAAYDDLGDYHQKLFATDFTEARVKGSIHHELTHWIDDTLNNRHIKGFVNNRIARQNAGKPDIQNVNMHYLERQAQIHNIKQLYNANKNDWDKMTFDDVINKSPALLWSKRLPDHLKQQWKRDIIKRMNREGLLGKNMR